MIKLDKERQGKANTIISEIEEFMFEFGGTNDTTDVLEYFASIISHLDTDIAIEVMEHFPKGKDIAQMMKDRIVLLNQNKDE